MAETQKTVDRDLTTEVGMKAWLCDHDYPCTTAERLPGGFGGFVYRVKLDSHPRGFTSVIAKHVADYAARAPAWKMGQERLYYEQRALTYVSNLSTQPDIPVRAPQILHYDNTSHVLIMEDAGNLPSVKEWFHPNASRAMAQKIGSALGNFLANFHDTTASDPAIMDEFAGNEPGFHVSSTLYFSGLAAAAEKFGHSDPHIARAGEVGAQEVREAREVLTLGDFWTGNVLVSAAEDAAATDAPEPELFVLDLELAKPGTAAFDVGQMAAEMYSLAAFRDRERGLALLEAFLRAYRARRKGVVDAAKVAVRIGAHLVVIVPSAWRREASEEQIRREVAFGVELIRIGTDLDMVGLRASIVRPLME